RHDHLRVRRHLSARVSNSAHERRERQRVRAEPRTGDWRSLTLAAVALVAAFAHEQLASRFHTRSRRRLRRRWKRQREHAGTERDHHHCTRLANRCVHRESRYRGCMITSTSAGSPRLTTSIARLMAGPRSAGLETGPCAYTPSPCASLA